MLWFKGWLETRYRFVFVLLMMSVIQFIASKPLGTQQGVIAHVLFTCPILVIMTCCMLGGAGVATQPSLIVTKGIHGSTLYTLSLPVSRLRLMSVRAAIGWLEAAGVVGMLCCALWFLSPPLRAMAGPGVMVQYVATLIGCASAIYFLAVLFGTVLDEQWRTWGTMMTCGGLWWLSAHVRLPGFLDIFRGMGKASPLFTHTVPWGSVAFSTLSAVVLFFASAKVLEAREY